MKPEYYKVMWHNCNRCRTHYTSEHPHLKAYLCDECWSAIPHFKVEQPMVVKKGPTYNKKDFNWKEIILYSIGNLICLGVIAYYLWFN
jgi:hypothetical protein